MPEETPSSSASPDGSISSVSEQTAEAVREALSSGENIQERVQSIVVDLFRGRAGAEQSLRAAVNGMLDTAAEVVRGSAPTGAENVLKGVIDGVASGVEKVAQAAGYAYQEARGRGERFAREDLDRVTKDLDSISQLLVETVSYASDRFAFESGSAVRELRAHAQRATDAVQPVISGVLDAIRRDPVQAASEAAGTTVRGSRLLAGAFLEAVSGVLSGAADLLKPDQDKRS